MMVKNKTFLALVLTCSFGGMVLLIKQSSVPGGSKPTIARATLSKEIQFGSASVLNSRKEVRIEDILSTIASYKGEKNVDEEKVLKELKSAVKEAQHRYDIVFKNYQEAIKSFERISADFDIKVRNGADRAVLEKIDHQLTQQTQEVLKLKHAANRAYVDLMADYDEAVPQIVARHFTGAMP